MSKRDQLLARLDEVATEFRASSPFAACVLNCLIGAMQTDVDRELAAVVLAWMQEELCITADVIAAAHHRQHDRRRNNPSPN
jgi:hypothetical protein